jgi:transposase
MMGSLDPVGMPRATDVLSGERADEGFYLPIIERIRTGLQTTGLWLVGDCQMSALDSRAYLARPHDWYLSPVPLTGATATAMDAWITTGGRKGETGA